MTLSKSRDAVIDLLRCYASAVDSRDWQGVRNCYFADAVDDHGVVVGDRDVIVKYFEKALINFENTMHLVGEPKITDLETNIFDVLTPCIALHLARSGSEVRNLIISALYRDRVENRNGTYAIAQRKVILQDAVEFERDSTDWKFMDLFLNVKTSL
jgi:3-phenylpropionate/cinnamic acid dioxygenase small subunit